MKCGIEKTRVLCGGGMQTGIAITPYSSTNGMLKHRALRASRRNSSSQRVRPRVRPAEVALPAAAVVSVVQCGASTHVRLGVLRWSCSKKLTPMKGLGADADDAAGEEDPATPVQAVATNVHRKNLEPRLFLLRRHRFPTTLRHLRRCLSLVIHPCPRQSSTCARRRNRGTSASRVHTAAPMCSSRLNVAETRCLNGGALTTTWRQQLRNADANRPRILEKEKKKKKKLGVLQQALTVPAVASPGAPYVVLPQLPPHDDDDDDDDCRRRRGGGGGGRARQRRRPC
jgi:hypothetical protein